MTRFLSRTSHAAAQRVLLATVSSLVFGCATYQDSSAPALPGTGGQSSGAAGSAGTSASESGASDAAGMAFGTAGSGSGLAGSSAGGSASGASSGGTSGSRSFAGEGGATGSSGSVGNAGKGGAGASSGNAGAGTSSGNAGAGASSGNAGVGGGSGSAGMSGGSGGSAPSAGTGGVGVVDHLLSQAKPATADSEQSSQGHTADSGNDGSLTTRWCANDSATGHYWKVDLGAVSTLSKLEVTWEKALIYKFKVEGSADGNTWSPLLDQTTSSNAAADQTYPLSGSPTARWVRLTVTGLANTSTWASFFEFSVYGH